MELREIHELEQKHSRQRLEQKLKEQQYKSQQEVINNGVKIVSDHINITTMSILSGLK